MSEATLSEVRTLRLMGALEKARKKVGSIKPQSPAVLLETALLDLEERRDPQDVLINLNDIRSSHDLTESQQGRLALAAGVARNRLGDGEKALDELLDALKRLRSAEDMDGAAEALNEMGVVFAWQGRGLQALTAYARALATWAEAENDAGLARTLANLGRYYMETQQWAVARDFLARALHMRESWGESREGLRLRLNLAQADLGEGAFEKALSGASTACKQAEAFKDTYLIFVARRERTLALIRLDADDASASLEELKTAAKESAGDYEEASLMAVEGEYLVRRSPQDALAKLEKALAWFVDNNLSGPAADIERLMAEAALADDNPSRAEGHIRDAINRARRAGLMPLIRKLKEMQARLGLGKALNIEEGRTLATDYNETQDGYVLRHVLGSGAFGKVYRAYDLEEDREIALKTLHLDGLYDPAERADIIASAKTELEATANLNHPGIAKVYAFGEDAAGGYYVAQELVQGAPLRARMNSQPDEQEIRTILGKTSQALAALHGSGVLHRDLKPENILMRGDENPVLVDFGIAYIGSPGEKATDRHGTPPYMSPEQLFGAPLDGRSDLYALGALAYEWLVGAPPPYPVPKRWALLARMKRRGVIRKGLKGVSLSKELKNLVESLLAYNPEGRPENASLAAAQFLE